MNHRTVGQSLYSPALACLMGLTPAAAAVTSSTQKPNIVIILADDLGYGDVQSYNPDGKIPTPNIDRLAGEGMRFTDGHAAAAGCTPSRYSLLTGRYDWRSHAQRGVFGGFGGPALIQPQRLTIAGLAKANGYKTSCIGKWHVGWNWPIKPQEYELLGLKPLATIIQESEKAGNPRNPSIEELAANGFYDAKPVAGYKAPVPTDQQLEAWRNIFSQPIGGGPTAIGFDYFFGIDAPGYPPFAYMENDRLLAIPTEFLPENFFIPSIQLAACQGPAVKGWDFDDVVPAMFKRARDYIVKAAEAKQPFLLHLPMPGPHQPWTVSKDWMKRSGLSLYADYVMETDAAIGELMATLEKAGVADNTIVIVSSDNGYSPYGWGEMVKKGHYSSGPFHGFKAQAQEGGHRVPFIVRWPAVVKPGSVSNQLVSQTDIMATMADIFGVQLPDNAGEDSFSFLPILKGEDKNTRPYIVNHSGQGGYGIRKGDWKLILEVDGRGVPVQLYNLAEDIGEKKNLADQKPEIVSELRALMEKLVADGRSTPGPRQQNDTEVLWLPRKG